MPYYISPPPRNPVTAVLAGLVGAVVLAGAFFLGFVALLVAMGLAVVAGIVVWIRVKWLQRRMRRSGTDPFADLHARQARRQEHGEEYIEGEYTVVREPDKD
ncbi:MAG: hypothetical protein HKN58_09620 [Xanthomonadales bacterium]|nr:hypothetical protein [Xanthomonadales bacterium]